MLLEVNNLTKSFGGIAALSNVSFNVAKGELSSVIGPNGAGKSTLFNVLTGYLPTDEGEVIFDSENITGLAPYEISTKRIGRSFQKVNIFPGYTVFRNVQISIICGEGKGLRFWTPFSRISVEETHQILEDVDLIKEMHRPAAELAYGDQKRLEIAIALTNKPKLLLLDEPTAGISPEETKSMAELIRNLVDQKGLSVVIVEHDMEMVFAISEKIRVLHQGSIIFEGTPNEVKTNKDVQRIYLGEEG